MKAVVGLFNPVRRRLPLMVMMLLISACQGVPVMLGYKNGVVPEEARIMLVEGETVSGRWETPDLLMQYQYRKNQSQLSLSGRIDFAGRIENNFPVIQYFHVDAIFLNDEGRVLEMKGLTSNPPSYSGDSVTFNNLITIPPGTASMAFSYRGEARSSGVEDDGGSMYFWEYPIR